MSAYNKDVTFASVTYEGTNGLASARWSRSESDFLGRNISESRSGFGGSTLITSNLYDSVSPREEFIPQFDDDMRPRRRRRVARRSEATEPRSGRKRPRNQTLIKTATGIWQVTYNGENRPTLWQCV